MHVEEALKHAKQVLPQKRYEHVERVTETALDLARHYGADPYQVGIAAAMHDYAKHMEKDLLKKWILSYTDLPKDLLNYHHELWHGPVGAKMIEHLFLIKDSEIINSIRYHTTGRHGMTLVEKIIFLADYIEPGRQFDAVHEARKLVDIDLNRACQYALKQSIIFLMSKGQPIYPDTFQAYNNLTKEIQQLNGGF
ncbi:bis(5'-nucleosyl)-tetraphosphatase (symmetrical) YqeK [Alkalibacillus aidingensis]|uniref:bis(5'-nucleosyl)-tetraphosphatase (symmetrical) YqeK n=1 Tax=Alkalibacillus aidingensis TaxID=2747607 RepID=UPI00166083ED|nr:bis(5'-nucleosyl)-tetraphosphatase (symmetrical) YqeK [Alkalibacillus aidingensis]